MEHINRLRARLKNAGRTTTDYRMTIQEARLLLSEIDKLIEETKKPPAAGTTGTAQSLPPISVDGGSF